jgi:hypothetical protein
MRSFRSSTKIRGSASTNDDVADELLFEDDPRRHIAQRQPFIGPARPSLADEPSRLVDERPWLVDERKIDRPNDDFFRNCPSSASLPRVVGISRPRAERAA